MEELIGKMWDRWITEKVSTQCPAASVSLNRLQPELRLYYLAVGGDQGKTIEAADRQPLRLQRTGLQRIAGSHQRFYLPWQDERAVRLPPHLAVFPEMKQNETLYFWLTAMAAYLPNGHVSVRDNQQAVRALTTRYPGLKKTYKNLLEKTLLLRPDTEGLSPELQCKELAVIKALKTPGDIQGLPASTYDVAPVCLWFYSAPNTLTSVIPTADKDEDEEQSANSSSPLKKLKQRKQAQRVDNDRETDGLLVFLPDTLTSWTEQVNVDRCEDDDDEEDIDAIVQDIDLITVSRQRKASAAKVKFDLDLPAEENDALCIGEGIRLPEWHYKKNQLVPDVCLLQTMLTDEVVPINLPSHLIKSSLEVRKLIQQLGQTRQRQRAQADGQALDIDAWIDHYAQPVKDMGQQNFFIDQRFHQRDFSCLILADLSLSTEGYINDDQRVIDVIRDSLFIFSEALNQLQDAFAIYGFSSVRNSHVRYHILKQFEERYSPVIRGRLSRIKPGFYTRMGAAIRQSSHILKDRPSAHRVMLILSDGKPNDLDQYEGRYGLEDTRQAIIEARKLGITPCCVTIDPEGHDYLPYLFGPDGFAVVTDVEQLPSILLRIYLNLSTR